MRIRRTIALCLMVAPGGHRPAVERFRHCEERLAKKEPLLRDGMLEKMRSVRAHILQSAP
jgi:hypothetical protein